MKNLGDYEAAITDYDAAIRLRPDYVNAYYNRGVAKAKLDQYAAAITDYDAAIQFKPDYTKAYFSRGLAKRSLNKTTEAKQDFQTALQLAKQAGNVKLEGTIENLLHRFK